MNMEGEEAEAAKEVRMYCGICPDSHCHNELYFIPNMSTNIECTSCGQTHLTSSLLNVKQTDGTSAALGNLLKSMLFNHSATKKGSELVKVRGLSNYHCKLVSPFLTHYGMDKGTGKAKLLSQIAGQPDVFDCAVFGNRAFLIEEEHLDIDGYGRDKSGSLHYLKATLELINKSGDEPSLIPLHVDGDGHCLVHAISRAVVGRELLWHSLRQNLHDHLNKENKVYQGLFHDFIGSDEWVDIIAEAHPEFYPSTNEPFGLRNIHVFGLANVLHRPIILLDSIEGMQSSGDYSGIFLPVLITPEKCKTKSVTHNPLVIAWSSSARNHYVPLVGIKGRPLPKIHQSMLPKAWGLSNQLVANYIDFDANDCCIIGGSRSLSETYIDRLVSAMDSVFYEKHQVSSELVADVNQFICTPLSAVSMNLSEVIEHTQKAVKSEMLHRCLMCRAVKEVKEDIPKSLRQPGGELYETVKGTDDGLIADAVYSFREYPPCIYSVQDDMLKPLNDKKSLCELCGGILREVRADGTVRYLNGDHTVTPSNATSGCKCGFKHFWNGKEYDNQPKSILVPLEWYGKKIEEQIFWFDEESDPMLNSNAYEIATSVVQKHFPGEFGSERLVKKVVDKILRETTLKQSEEEANPQILKKYMEHGARQLAASDDRAQASNASPSKIILTGPKKKTLHKEELNQSEAERLTKARISHHAAFSQKRKNISHIEKQKMSGSAKQGKQELTDVVKDVRKQASVSSTSSEQSTSVQPAPTSSSQASISGSTSSKIRLSSADGRQATVTLKPSATYEDLQQAVVEKFGIPKERQKFRYGFPPRELLPPSPIKESAGDGDTAAAVAAALPLSNGDRVTVEEIHVPVEMVAAEQLEEGTAVKMEEDVPSDDKMETVTSGVNDWPVQGSGGLGGEYAVNREQWASDLQNLLRALNNVDHWETMQHQPEQFVRGGFIYENVVRELGPLQDDQHCSITELPGKRLAYNAKEDRLEICLGQKHVPIQPLDPSVCSQNSTTTGGAWSGGGDDTAGSAGRQEGLGAFSGVIPRNRDDSKGRSAFSGSGRTLGGNAMVGQNDKEDTEKSSLSNKMLATDIPTTNTLTRGDVTSQHKDDVTKVPPTSGSSQTATDDNDPEAMVVDEPSEGIDVPTDEKTVTQHENKTHTEMGSVHEAGEVVHETPGAKHEKIGDKHEDRDAMHEERTESNTVVIEHETVNDTNAVISITNEDLKVEHAETVVEHENVDAAHEMMTVTNEETVVQHEETSVEHAKMQNEELDVAREDASSAHERMIITNEDIVVDHAETVVEHEKINAMHEDGNNTHERMNITNKETVDEHEKMTATHGDGDNTHERMNIANEGTVVQHEEILSNTQNVQEETTVVSVEITTDKHDKAKFAETLAKTTEEKIDSESIGPEATVDSGISNTTAIPQTVSSQDLSAAASTTEPEVKPNNTSEVARQQATSVDEKSPTNELV